MSQHSKNKILGEYEKLLESAADLDSLIEEEKGWTLAEIKDDKIDEYWELREHFEEDVPEWMANVRKAIYTIPSDAKEITKEEYFDEMTGGTRTISRYENMDFESLMQFYKHIVYAVESHDGVLERVKRTKRVHDKLRSVRSDVLSLCQSLELFVPDTMISIDQQVELIFGLRDKGMTDIASLIEEIDQITDNVRKALNARTALEKTIDCYCKMKSVEIKKGFYTNLDNAIAAGLTSKAKRKAIAGHYTFASKLIHGSTKANVRNTQFAVNGILNILSDLVKSISGGA